VFRRRPHHSARPPSKPSFPLTLLLPALPVPQNRCSHAWSHWHTTGPLGESDGRGEAARSWHALVGSLTGGRSNQLQPSRIAHSPPHPPLPLPPAPPHKHVHSPQQHHTEKAGRRCPRTFRYSAVRCPQHNKKLAGGGRATCPKGDNCGCAHTVYELWCVVGVRWVAGEQACAKIGWAGAGASTVMPMTHTHPPITHQPPFNQPNPTDPTSTTPTPRLHPDRFRTQMCLHGQACTKPLCFFAHTAAELRSPQQLHGDDPSGGDTDGRDPAEMLVELHAAHGGGRFSLAAAMAEVQLRQRRLYGAAPPGRAMPPAAAAAAAAGQVAAVAAALQHQQHQQMLAAGLGGAAGFGGGPGGHSDLAFRAAAAAFAAQQGWGGMGGDPAASPALALQLLGQQLAQAQHQEQQEQKRRFSDTQRMLHEMAAAQHAQQRGGWPPAVMTPDVAAWMWDHTMAAAAAAAGASPTGSSPTSVGGVHPSTLQHGSLLGASAGLHAMPDPSAAASAAAAAALGVSAAPALGSLFGGGAASARAPGSGVSRHNSLLWSFDPEPSSSAAAAAAAAAAIVASSTAVSAAGSGQQLPLDGVTRTGSSGSTRSTSSSSSLMGITHQPPGSIATSGGLPVAPRSSDSSGMDGLLGSTPTAGYAVGGSAAAAAAAAAAPARAPGVPSSVNGGALGSSQLHEQLQTLQREQEQQAIKLRMLQLQCQGGFAAAPTPAAQLASSLGAPSV